MDQLSDLADDRLLDGCIYCGGYAQTREHVPSKVFLDAPFPENLPVVAACLSCNNGFSLDEEYVACAIDAAKSGSTDPARIERKSIAEKFHRNSRLRALIDASTRQVNGASVIDIDVSRFVNIVLKLARGHAAFELSEPMRHPPQHVSCRLLEAMSEEDVDLFELEDEPIVLGEIGSRGLQRMAIIQAKLLNQAGEEENVNFLWSGWVDVQEGLYRYLTTVEPDCTRVRIVIGEYLACEVRWN
jgi:hypothetical protein